MVRKITSNEELNIFVAQHIENLEAVLQIISDSDEDIRIRFTWKEHIRTLWNQI